MTSFHPALADLTNLPWVALVSIGGGLIVGPTIIFIVFNAIQRRHELWHETARVALEKGQPLPPMPADIAPPPSNESGSASEFRTESRPANDIRTGLILIATGGGLWLFFSALIGNAFGYIGAIPGFIGVALLLFGVLNAATKHNRPPGDRH